MLKYAELNGDTNNYCFKHDYFRNKQLITDYNVNDGIV